MIIRPVTSPLIRPEIRGVADTPITVPASGTLGTEMNDSEEWDAGYIATGSNSCSLTSSATSRTTKWIDVTGVASNSVWVYAEGGVRSRCQYRIGVACYWLGTADDDGTEPNSLLEFPAASDEIRVYYNYENDGTNVISIKPYLT